jgi:hypothetical protein
MLNCKPIFMTPLSGVFMAMYESEITKFVRDMLEESPQLKTLQKQNRATWWDKTLDADELKRNEISEAPKAAYAYFPLPAAAVELEK